MNTKPRFCQACSAGCTTLLSGLTKSQRQWVSHWLCGLPTIQYGANERIIHEGLPALGLYLVCNGRVKFIQRGSGQKKQIIKLVGPGEILGEEGLFGDGVYSFYAKAMEPVEVKFISKAQFDELVQHCPQFLRRLMQKIALELKALHKRILEQSFNSCKERVARLLLVLSQKYGRMDERGYLQVDLLRADLAKMVGTSVETAIRELSYFESKGWIQVSYHTITMINPDGLLTIGKPLGVELMENVL
ncbi:MAG TPA: Crp/Fnr family transcriptional regulator [Candidatus Bipolaricaulota bacterium]